MSKVPPPKSYTAIFSFFFLLNPYASAAAVGSLIMRFTSKPAIFPASLVALRCASLKYAGTVMTASSIFSPAFASASCLSFCSTIAEISSGRYHFSPIFTFTLFSSPFSMENATFFTSRWTPSSSNLWPIRRLIPKSVFSGLVTAWRFAESPTRRSPDLESATIDGVVRAPSAFSITRGSPPSTIAIAEFVVPRSMPKIFPIVLLYMLCDR